MGYLGCITIIFVYRIRSHRLHEPEIVAVAADELDTVEASDEEPVISREDRIAMMAERRRREADEDREASSEEEEMLDEEVCVYTCVLT